MTMIRDGTGEPSRVTATGVGTAETTQGVGNMFEPLEDCTEDARVSTIDLGHAARDGYRYETMVFGGMLDGYCERYRMDGDAREGHRETVEKVLDVEAGFYTTGTRN